MANETENDVASVNDGRNSNPRSSSDRQTVQSEWEGQKNILLWMLLIGLGLIVLAFALNYAFGVSEKNDISLQDLTITQPFVENNEFKTFILENGLKVMLSKSNDGMEYTYVSLSVGVGSQSDPVDFCGFTHLIEHLLFTGSKEYPEDNYIEKVINKYNGANNGVTKSFTTSYFYKVGNEGIDEFASVLVDAVSQPLFDEERVTKEMNNVNSEISMRVTYNKKFGYYKMIKKIGNPLSRVYRDGLQNIDVEKQNVSKLKERITDFHNKYYSSNIMTLAVITDLDLYKVEPIIRNQFINIPNKNIERPLYNDTETMKNYQPPFLEEAMGQIFYTQGFDKPSKFLLIFQVPSERKEKHFRPLQYFSFFLNYYSKNSFKDRLIRMGLISDFDDEIDMQDYTSGVYIVSFDLTEEGEKNISKIMMEFFKFVNFVKNLNNLKQIYEEGSKLSKYAFLFNISSEFFFFPEMEQDNFDRVLEFSEKMQEYSYNEIFSQGQIWDEYEDFKFKSVLESLRPEKSIIIIESLKFVTASDNGLLDWTADDFNGVNIKKKEIEDFKNESLDKMNEANKNPSSSSKEVSRKLLESISKMPKESQIRDKILNAYEKIKNEKNKIKHVERQLSLKLSKSDSQKYFSNDIFDDELEEDVLFKERKLEEIFMNPVFDEAIGSQSIELRYAFDFDNAKRFHYVTVDKEVWRIFNKYLENNTENFDSLENFNVTEVIGYEMITNKCEPDEEISIHKESESENKVVNPTKEQEKEQKTEDLVKPIDNSETENKEIKPKNEEEQLRILEGQTQDENKPTEDPKVTAQENINTQETEQKPDEDNSTNETPDKETEQPNTEENPEHKEIVNAAMDEANNTSDTDETPIDPSNLRKLDILKVSHYIFDNSYDKDDLLRKIVCIQKLLKYKICLIGEFENDDNDPKPELIEDNKRSKVFYKLYRKTLQAKFGVQIMIENEKYQTDIIKGDSHQKQRFYLMMELICLYIKHHFSLEFYEEFTLGNDMDIDSHSYAIFLTFIGPSSDLSSFINKLLNSMNKLTDPKNFDNDILNNLKRRIIDNYSNFSTLTSLKYSTYILDLIVDELSIDTRNDDNIKQLEEWINSFGAEELAEAFKILQSNNKLTLLFSGNVSKEEAKKETEELSKILLKDKDASISDESVYSKNINNVLDNMLLRFGENQHHYMVRVPNINPEDKNNVYLTYFRTSKETTKIKLIGTMLSHWLRNYVFDKLRNQMNLGYVAHESVREYYFRTGLIILVQGENFRPNEIEGDVADTIREFIEILKNKSNDELEDLKNMVVKYYTEYSNTIEDVLSKQWNIIQDDYVLNESESYIEIADKITLEDLLEYCQSTFFDNQKRITIELFSGKVSQEEANYKIDPKRSLIKLPYELKTIEEMIEIRESSVQKFARKLLLENK